MNTARHREGERYTLWTPPISLSSFNLRDSSSEHKAHLIGWAFPWLLGPQPNAEHQTLCDVLTFSLSFIPVPLTLPLAAHQRLLLSAKTLLMLCTDVAPQRFLAYQMTLGPQGFLPDMIWDLAVAMGPLFTPHALLCTRALVCFWKYFSLSWTYYIRNSLLTTIS